MKEQLEQRLQKLESEYGNGQKMLADLDRRRSELNATLLRIEGAITVLAEFATEEGEQKKP